MNAGDIVYLRATGEAVRIIQRFTAPGQHDQPESQCEIECGVRGSDRVMKRVVRESELVTRLELFR